MEPCYNDVCTCECVRVCSDGSYAASTKKNEICQSDLTWELSSPKKYDKDGVSSTFDQRTIVANEWIQFLLFGCTP